jgi:hypothetical protein
MACKSFQLTPVPYPERVEEVIAFAKERQMTPYEWDFLRLYIEAFEYDAILPKGYKSKGHYVDDLYKRWLTLSRALVLEHGFTSSDARSAIDEMEREGES